MLKKYLGFSEVMFCQMVINTWYFISCDINYRAQSMTQMAEVFLQARLKASQMKTYFVLFFKFLKRAFLQNVTAM